MATTSFQGGGYSGRPYGSFAGRAPAVEPTPVVTTQKRGFAGFPRSNLWIAHINGKRYVGTYDELETILGEVVEKTEIGRAHV